jgi:hypothetical protein
MHQRDHRRGSTVLRLRVEYLRHFGETAAGSAVLRGNQQAKHTCDAQGVKIFARETASLIDLIRVGAKRLMRKLFVFGKNGLDVRHESSTPQMFSAIKVRNTGNTRQRGYFRLGGKLAGGRRAPLGGNSSKTACAAQRSSN